MPTILRISGYRFFFFSLEGNEPAHVHVEYNDKIAKFWIDPVSLASSNGFRKHELTKMRAIIIENRLIFLEKWYAHFGH
jgi:hypothetical protein